MPLVIVLAITAIKEDELLGDNLGAKVPLALCTIPMAGLKFAFDIDLRAFVKTFLAQFGQPPPSHDVEPFRFLMLTTFIRPTVGRRYAKGSDRPATGGKTHFWIPS